MAAEPAQTGMPGPEIHTQQFWDEFTEQFDAQLDQFRGITYSEVTDEVRTEFATVALHGLARLMSVVQRLALEQHAPAEQAPPPKPPRTRKPRAPKAVEGEVEE